MSPVAASNVLIVSALTVALRFATQTVPVIAGFWSVDAVSGPVAAAARADSRAQLAVVFACFELWRWLF